MKQLTDTLGLDVSHPKGATTCPSPPASTRACSNNCARIRPMGRPDVLSWVRDLTVGLKHPMAWERRGRDEFSTCNPAGFWASQASRVVARPLPCGGRFACSPTVLGARPCWMGST